MADGLPEFFMNAKFAPLLIVAGLFFLCFQAVRGPEPAAAPAAAEDRSPNSSPQAAEQITAWFETRWQTAGLTPAEPADELLVLRRLALALMGTLPSLEEIRQFEADQEPQRLERWTARYLRDRRFADYFAERLARCFVGSENGAFIIFRRDRFVSWLSAELQKNTPYDELVRTIVAGRGLWTGEPQSNFVTAAYANEDLDENKLAARSVRAFLGQSMDCAQCHDHPFANWKQQQFEGIAAQFSAVEVGPLGVHDGRREPFKVQDRKTLEDREVAAAVPFQNEWLSGAGTQREQFAAWLTHPENRHFERAIANRVWGLMFGRPYVTPVDDMPNPPDAAHRDVLDLLAEDFRAHDCSLKRMIEVIAASRPFRLQSRHAIDGERLDDSADPDRQAEMARAAADQITALHDEWAIFPLTRLRPEQVIGSMLQASSIQTIDQNSHLFTRAQRFFRERDFVNAYGDLGDQELVEQTGTIPQALLRMNSDMTRDAVKADLFAASSRVARMCPSPKDVIETAYLICLTRRPQAEELAWFEDASGKSSEGGSETVVEDLFWTLFNAEEFSWNH